VKDIFAILSFLLGVSAIGLVSKAKPSWQLALSSKEKKGKKLKSINRIKYNSMNQ